MGLPVGTGRPATTHGRPSEIIRLLREIRIEKNISVLNLAIDIDVNESNLSRYERGVDTPNILTIERWARSLGYELDLHPIGE